MSEQEIRDLMHIINNYPKFAIEVDDQKQLKINVLDFSKESNNIEGIFDEKQHQALADMTVDLLSKDMFEIIDVVQFAATLGGPCRIHNGMNVRIGTHYPPKGGPQILSDLGDIVNLMNNPHKHYSAHRTHVEFETLHPFMDGNGRTGRALWLWQMVKHKNWQFQRTFLHEFYYQSLQSYRPDARNAL